MRNDLSKERFRNEWKYLISTSEKELLELRMKHLLKKDPNAKGNGYMPGKGDIISAVCILRITGTVHTRKRKPGY